MELKTLQAIAKNNTYWDDRVKLEQQWMQKNLADDKAYAAHLNGYYDKALKGIQDKINDQYTRFAGSEGYSIADAVKTVKGTDIRAYEKEAADIVKQSRQMFKEKGGPLTFADFEPEVNRRMRVYNATMRINRLEYLKSQIGLEAIKAGVEVNADLAAKLNDDYINEVKRQSGVLGEYTPPASFANGKRAAQVIMANANHNGFSQTLWKNTDAFKADLDIQLNNVMVQGLNGRDMMKTLRQHLSDSVDKARYVTERLARTESARVQAEAQNDIYKELGVTKVKWIAEPSACEQCLDIAEGHGKGEKETGVYSITEAPSIPVHPNCRCSKAPIADRRQMEQLIDRASAEQGVASVTEQGSALPDELNDEEIHAYAVKLRLGQTKPQEADINRIGEYINKKHKIGQGIAKRYDQIVNSPIRKEVDAVYNQYFELKKQVDSDFLVRWNYQATWDKDKFTKWEKEHITDATEKLNALVDKYNSALSAKKKFANKIRDEQMEDFTHVLAEYRSVGRNGVKTDFAKRSNAKVKKLIDTAYDHYPTQWFTAHQEALKVAGHGINAKNVKRGYFRPSDYTVSMTIGEERVQSTAIHELTHFTEATNSTVRDLENQFYERRTNGEKLEWLGDITGNRTYAQSEVARKDQFVEAYMGKDYRPGRNYKPGTVADAYEIATMGVEGVYRLTYNLSKDPDYLNFIIGLITTV